MLLIDPITSPRGQAREKSALTILSQTRLSRNASDRPGHQPKRTGKREKCTHDPESNMLESMKHCVAMGGVCEAGWTGAPGCDAGFILRALAATCGIWKPVPETTIKPMFISQFLNQIQLGKLSICHRCVWVCLYDN